MDDLVEKATELGVAAIQPLLCERSVLRLSGERAAKKVQHWRGVAVAACEQSGRTRLPLVHEVQPLHEWLRGVSDTPATGDALRVMLSLSAGSRPFDAAGGDAGILFLSGPEGGLSAAEEAAARAVGFAPVSLGARVLRAELHFDLPPGAARHVQVLRLQPGTAITLFDGRGGEWSADSSC